MAITNCLFSPTSENPRGFSATSHTQNRRLQFGNDANLVYVYIKLLDYVETKYIIYKAKR